MLIHKFFKPQSKTLDDLPKELLDPSGPLTKTVSPSVIKMAYYEKRTACLHLNHMGLDLPLILERSLISITLLFIS